MTTTETVSIKRPEVLDRAEALGFKIFTGPGNPNLVGVRAKGNIPNSFDDRLGVCWQDSAGQWHSLLCPATTDPGSYWLANPSQVDGTAIVVPGQYRGLWQFGKHRGEYEALVQLGKIKVWRDPNKDGILDRSGKVYEGVYGINMHHASSTHTSTTVDKWSAGCQVFADLGDFNVVLSVCRASLGRWGSTFTYTLLDEWR